MVGQNVYKEEEITFILDMLVAGVDAEVISNAYYQRHNKTLTPNQLRYVKNKYGKDPKYGTRMINTDMGKKRKRNANGPDPSPRSLKVAQTSTGAAPPKFPNLVAQENPSGHARAPRAPMAVMTDETQHPAATVAPVPPGLMLPPSSPEEVAQYAQSARRLSQQQQRETQLQQPLPILRSQASTSTQRQPSYNSSERPPSSAFLAAQAATGALFNQMGRHGVFNPAAYNAMHAFYTPDQAGHSSVEHAQRTLQTQGPVFTSVDGIYPIDTQGYPEQNASTTTGTGSGSGTGASSGSATANNSILQNYPYQQWQYLQPSQMTQPASYPNFQFQQYQYQQGLHDYRNVVEGQTYGVTSTRPRANVVQSSEQLAGGNTASYGRRQSAGQPVSRRGTPSAQDNNTHAHPQMSQMNQMNQMNQMQQMHQMGAQGIAYRPPTAPSSVGDASTPRFPTPSEVTNNSTVTSPTPTTGGASGRGTSRASRGSSRPSSSGAASSGAASSGPASPE